MKNCVKMIRFYRALEAFDSRVLAAKFLWRVNNMARLNDYHMSDRC